MRIAGAVLERMGDPIPFAQSRPIVVEELELDAPGAHEVLVAVQSAGVCHSDLSVVTGDRPRPLPMLLGHEAAGVVEAVGEAVTGLSVGDHVVASFLPRCGECAECRTDGRVPCSRGSASNGAGTLLGGGERLSRNGERVHHHLGVSGFATHAVIHESSLVRVDDDVPFDVAALLGCAVLTGGGAVLNAARPEPGQRLAVVGLGGVGMAAVLTALAHDGVEVIGVDAAPAKLAWAERLGVRETYSPQEVAEQGVVADRVVEAAGNPRAFETAVAMTDVGGTTVTVGLPRADAMSSISPLALVSGARQIIGSYLGSAVPSRDIPRFAELWRAGRLPVEELISDRIPLGDVAAAMDHLADGSALRQIIHPTP